MAYNLLQQTYKNIIRDTNTDRTKQHSKQMYYWQHDKLTMFCNDWSVSKLIGKFVHLSYVHSRKSLFTYQYTLSLISLSVRQFHNAKLTFHNLISTQAHAALNDCV